MPCYLFTYHAYGSWLPDHVRGYVHRGQGVLAPDQHMAELYRANLKGHAVRFTAALQRRIIEAALEACGCQQLRCHCIATESTHIHILASWNSHRTWVLARKQIRRNITERLNQLKQRPNWFSKSPSRKRVQDRTHFDYLISTYLPRHSGWKWSEARGMFC